MYFRLELEEGDYDEIDETEERDKVSLFSLMEIKFKLILNFVRSLLMSWMQKLTKSKHFYSNY